MSGGAHQRHGSREPSGLVCDTVKWEETRVKDELTVESVPSMQGSCNTLFLFQLHLFHSNCCSGY